MFNLFIFLQVALHFWGTGGDALPVVSFLFLRDLCVRLGSDCLDECFRGIYKAYVLNCHFVNASKLQHIQFLANCVIELILVDLPTAYQHAFIFIRQLAMLLRDALNMKTKVSFTHFFLEKCCRYPLPPENNISRRSSTTIFFIAIFWRLFPFCFA